MKKVLLAGVAALSLATGTAHADDKPCVRELLGIGLTKADAKRACDDQVKPNEYGWVCENPETGKLHREKGKGTRRKSNAVCE